MTDFYSELERIDRREIDKELRAQVDELRADLSDLSEQIENVRSDISSLLMLWNSASGTVWVVKRIALTVIGAAAFFAAVKSISSQFFKG